MIYDVEFSLDAAAELLRIAEVVGSATLVLQAADQIRRQLESDPAEKGTYLSEGLYYIDEQPLRAFFLIDVDSMVVESPTFEFFSRDHGRGPHHTVPPPIPGRSSGTRTQRSSAALFPTTLQSPKTRPHTKTQSHKVECPNQNPAPVALPPCLCASV
jgi:hypothetical protein